MPSFAAILTVLVVLSASFYQLWLKPNLELLGVFKRGKIVDVGAVSIPGKCQAVGGPDKNDPNGILSACEKIVLHQPSGLLYLACSTPESRSSWTPAAERLSTAGRSSADYLATYDPLTKTITKLTFDKYYAYPAHGFSAHGMDVVQSKYDKNELFIYAINHRLPKDENGEDLDPKRVGADSAIDMFKTRVGSASVEYLTTFVDPTTIITPNDLVGRVDGMGFWFTNDHSTRIGLKRSLHLPIFGVADTSVGYCHVKNGCKFAAEGLRIINGITANLQNGTFYIGTGTGKVLIMEVENEDELVQVGEVDLGSLILLLFLLFCAHSIY
jgi:arylesterase/paraoxonase